MAIDNQFGKGIGVAAGFDLGAQKPLDSRVAVNTIAERDAHIENNRAYEGMLVYVAEANMTYQLVKGEEEGQLVWKEFGFNQNDFDESFEGAIQGVDERLQAVEADLAQGGETEGRIAQAESDIDGLQGLVGQPAQAGEGEEEGTPATGLHLAVEQAKEEAANAVAGEKERAEGQEAAIRQELADEAAEIRGEMAEQHQAMNEAMAQAHQEMNEAMEQAVAGEKQRAEGQEAAIRQELADEAAEIRQEMADESAARVAEEQRIEGKVDAEAQRADAEEKRIVGLVEAEAEAARAAELKLTQDLAKEVEDRGKAVQDLADRHDQEMEAAAEQVGKDLAALKEELQGEIDADVAAEAKLREDADKALDERVKPLEAHVAAQPGVDAEQDRRIKALEDDAPVKQAAIEAAQAAADKAQGEVDLVEERATALEEDVARLDGAVDVEGSVKKQIKDAVDAINADAEALEARVKANEDDIAEINGVIGVPAVEADENGEGGQAATGMHKLIADEDARVLSEAKAHAEQKIADLVDAAPDAMNTLNELAKAINDNKDVYDGYVEQHAQAMAALKEELQGEIDADVKVVADELAKQMDAEQGGTLANGLSQAFEALDGHNRRLNGHDASIAHIESQISIINGEGVGSIKAAVEAEKERAEGQEAAIRQEMATEAQRVDKKIADDIAAESALRVAEEQRIEGKVDAEAQRADAEEKRIVGLVETEKGRAEGQEAAIRGEMATEAQRVDKKIADDIAAESALRVAEEQRIEKALGDAIAKEVEDRDAAILVEKNRAEGQEAAIRGEFAAADTALHATIKGEMAAVIQSLSASITEDGKLRIALGGIEGDEVLVIREQEIPFVTDEEIDEIIASLDAE